MDAEDMAYEVRLACLMYADDCALFATSAAELRHLYDELHEVFRRDGMGCLSAVKKLKLPSIGRGCPPLIG